MIYVYLGLFLAGLGIGGIGMHLVDQAEILRMQLSIEQTKTTAANDLAKATEKVNQATQAAIANNQQLETAHAQSLTTINAYHEQLANVRLFDHGGNRCSGASTPATGNSATEPDSSTDTTTLSAAFDGFLKQQFYDADSVAAYAAEAWQFINIQHCGIAP